VRCCGRLTKTRLPPTWLVLLPALALAAVGVRAVTAEMRASQDAARDRARSIASRLARSVDALVAEYAAPLPKPGTKLTRAEAIEATSHLQPRRAITADGVSLALDHALPPDPGPIPGKEQALVAEALSRAKRLADEPNGSIAAAALTSGAATVVEHPVSKARLLYAAAEYEIPTAPIDRPPATLEEALGAGAWLRDLDGFPFDVRGAIDLIAFGDREGNLAPIDVATLYARLVEDPWGGGYVGPSIYTLSPEPHPATVTQRLSLGRVEAAWRNRLGDRSFDERAAWESARRIAREPPDSSALPHAAFEFSRDGKRPRLFVWTTAQIDGRFALLGGDVPTATVEDRIGKETAALSREPRAAGIRLVGPDGNAAFISGGVGGSAPDDQIVVETSRITSVDGGWRAQAVVAPESGVPATAWLLAAAVVVTTAALLAGTLALRRAAERSARLAEERRTFLDHVAHELRTPAAAVQALSEELASGHVAAAREPEYRRHLLAESRRLAGLVDDTLDFARLDAGRLAFKMEDADVRDVVRRAIEESDGAGRVKLSLPDEPVVRPVDEAALRRAVKNLVENAARHGGGDGPIDVALEARNGAVSVTVADHGRGIASEHLPRIFERFWRAPSATHETKGVGLGLALCREVARAHGGDVSVVSRVGEGSTFTLRMPIQ